MKDEHQRLIEEALRIKSEIRQLYTDTQYWNTHVRDAATPPIDPDPDGEMAACEAYLDSFLASNLT